MASRDASDKDRKTDEDQKEGQEADDRHGVERSAVGTAPVSTTDFLSSLLGSLNVTESHDKVIEDFTLSGIAEYIQTGKAQNIITMAGAGISTSAGIPDFRSPGSGLYDNLAKYNLPHPQAVFDLEYFEEHPEPFFHLAKELWPGTFKPTPCHYFLRYLQDKRLLLRHYTQNIDTLERVAGIDDDHIVEAHGTFYTAHCLKCRHQYSQDWMKAQVLSGTLPTCSEKAAVSDTGTEEPSGGPSQGADGNQVNPLCRGLVKPDIVFFGEKLPDHFFQCVQQDFSRCDLLIILGTSLVVQPFASLIERVGQECPRLYINLEKSRSACNDPMMALMGFGSTFRFDSDDNYRDVFHQATCDDGCLSLADQLGWGDELRGIVKAEHKKIDVASTTDTSSKPPSEKPTKGSL